MGHERLQARPRAPLPHAATACGGVIEVWWSDRGTVGGPMCGRDDVLVPWARGHADTHGARGVGPASSAVRTPRGAGGRVPSWLQLQWL